MTRNTPAHRGFRLVVQPVDTDSYGLLIEETNSLPEHSTVVARLTAEQLTPFLGALRVALRDSGHPPTIVGPSRRKAVPLDEAAAIRFALAVNAAAPLTRPVRRLTVIEGVSAMSDEEAYYWYAKTTRKDSGRRALRALRILLADDNRTGITS